MMTDAGQLIRTDVRDIRIAGRTTRGVTLFRVAGDERVVTVTSLDEVEDDEDDEDGLEGEGQDAADGSTESAPTEAAAAEDAAMDGAGEQDDDS